MHTDPKIKLENSIGNVFLNVLTFNNFWFSIAELVIFSSNEYKVNDFFQFFESYIERSELRIFTNLLKNLSMTTDVK
jgi:hypothetical protein